MMRTIKLAIVDALEDLSPVQFDKFCHQLCDRREKPWVTRSSVLGKDRLDVADHLVSTFTERRALDVTLETLRQINCNDEAERLDSDTKILTDKGDPTFRRNSKGELVTELSQEARNHLAASLPLQTRRPSVMIKTPEDVEAEARARVTSEGGDSGNDRLVLSRFTIQFGQYKGQTFKWLLENDVSYATFLLASHLSDQVDRSSQCPHMANKDALTRYSMIYPDFAKEVRFRQPCPDGTALVGFGQFASETLESLYKSKAKGKNGYVNYLRSMEATCTPGSPMEVAIRYIRQRDQGMTMAARRTSSAAARASTSFANRPSTRRHQVRRTHVHARSALWPTRRMPQRGSKPFGRRFRM